MLSKFFCNKFLTNISSSKLTPHAPPPSSSENHPSPVEKGSRALQIIHKGGLVECYYMAIPAASIIEKYPSFILTRPEIFRKPWDSIVRPEEILVPGQKYYVVPRQTVRKLRRRMTKTSRLPLLASSSRVEEVSTKQGDRLSTSIMVKPGSKVNTQKHRVRFFGIENKESASESFPCDRREESNTTSIGRMRNHSMDAKRGARNQIENSWEPSLNSINENMNVH